MPVPTALPGFNVSAAVGRMLDQPELWWQSVGLFVENYSAWGREWQMSMGDEDLERRRVHALRSAAANVGAEQLSMSAAALETCLLQAHARQPGADVVGALRLQLASDYEAVINAAAQAWRENADGMVNAS